MFIQPVVTTVERALDARSLNKATQNKKYQMPTLDNTMEGGNCQKRRRNSMVHLPGHAIRTWTS